MRRMKQVGGASPSVQPTPYGRPIRATDDGSLRLEAIMHLRPHLEWDLGPHLHADVHELVYIRQGVYFTRIGDDTFELDPETSHFTRAIRHVIHRMTSIRK